MSRKLDVAALAAKAETGNNSSVRRIETLNMNLGDLLLEGNYSAVSKAIRQRQIFLECAHDRVNH